MHPRNKYLKNPVDFGELAEFRPSLKPYLIDKHSTSSTSSKVHGKDKQFSYTVDFSDPLVIRELTCAVLERDFDLRVSIPSGFLVPVVPQKLNYILWIEDLISPRVATVDLPTVPKGKEIFGIDIGTGTSCIYPLLGSRLNGWSFVATEVSEAAVESARRNVNVNNLQDSIEVFQISPGTILEELLKSRTRHYSFTMCNPPFFKSQKDKLGQENSRSDSRPVPSTCNTGTVTETITEGGELRFVKDIVRDSLKYKNRVQWYTSMLGRKANLKEVIKELKNNEVPVVTTTEFVQGKTWRWGVAWSFDCSLKNKEYELKGDSRKRRQAAASGDVLQLLFKGRESLLPSTSRGLQEAKKWLENQLDDLEIERELVNSRSSDELIKTQMMVQYQCHAHKATWAHQRKKRRLLHKLSELHENSTSEALALNDRRSETSSNIEDLSSKIHKELDSLSPPCDVTFTCEVLVAAVEEINRHIKIKKALLEPKERDNREKEAIAVELQWLGSDSRDKDMLHQIMQYLSNKMDAADFNSNIEDDNK